MKKFDPAQQIQNLQHFGEFGGVNPSITDSSTYTFLKAKTMFDTFEGKAEGCFLYSRHTNPSDLVLSEALAAMENTEAAHVTGSGMGAITSVIMQLCKSGDEIVSSRTIYGGTHAFMNNFLPRLGIKVHFVDICNLEEVRSAINEHTTMVYTEALSNPLLEVANIPELAKITKANKVQLVVDNTFTPLVISPANLGADVVIHSLTKYINGSSDTTGGAICGSRDFINQLLDVNSGACMLFGPVLDSMRAASILKNLRTLHLRMVKHSENARYLVDRFKELGLDTLFVGHPDHPDHKLFNQLRNDKFGYSGMLTLTVESLEVANKLMELMQERNLGYLAVSLGYYKTLFSASASSTSSEIPEEEQEVMGLKQGLIRFSIGLDTDIEETFHNMKSCMEEAGVLKLTKQ